MEDLSLDAEHSDMGGTELLERTEKATRHHVLTAGPTTVWSIAFFNLFAPCVRFMHSYLVSLPTARMKCKRFLLYFAHELHLLTRCMISA